jgi:hypothetical protein
VHTWEIYYPAAAATGMPFARSRIDATDVVWLHSAPHSLAVTVREGDEDIIGRGEPLERQGQQFPMTRLALRDGQVTREDRFPTQADLGAIVILPGGEAGVLKAWWNADDAKEWRCQVEFYNSRR